MDIADKITQTETDNKARARSTYFRIMTTERPENETVPDDELAEIMDAMSVLEISPQESDEDARAYKQVLVAQAAIYVATVEFDIRKPKGDLSFREQIDNFDTAIKRDIDALLRPKRQLLEQLERFEDASQILKDEKSRLATSRRKCSRLCG